MPLAVFDAADAALVLTGAGAGAEDSATRYGVLEPHPAAISAGRLAAIRIFVKFVFVL